MSALLYNQFPFMSHTVIVTPCSKHIAYLCNLANLFSFVQVIIDLIARCETTEEQLIDQIPITGLLQILQVVEFSW